MAAILANYRSKKKIGNQIHCAASKVDETWWEYSLIMDYYVKVQHLGETAATRKKNSRKRKQDGKIWLKSCFGRGGGVSEIQCIIFKQNNVNPYEIYNICIEISIVLHSRIIFFREKENFLPAILVI